jgi:SAM-dependent methyltransferase
VRLRLAKGFARFAATLVVRAPWAWRLLRGRLTRTFDRLAPGWDGPGSDPRRLAALESALDAIHEPPTRVLDLGTGTGSAARLAAGRWPAAEVVGADVSPGMIAEARRREPVGSERFELADASRLPFADGSFDLVTLNNMIPFFDELARVTAPGGTVAIAFSHGPKTPIWVPLERVRAELERRGFEHVATFTVGQGRSLLARRRPVP